MTKPEGFADSNSYNVLKSKIQMKLANYCKLTEFAQNQMKTMYTSSGNGSETDAMSYIQQTYRSVYSCTDELARSRACQIVSGDFLPCTTYTNLPAWSDDEESLAIALSKIPNNLARRIMAESSYYTLVIQKLQTGIDAARNPPSTPPDSPSSPASSPSGKPWGVEGFNSQCSPAAAQARRERMRLDALSKSAESCTMPSLDSEIARVGALLDSGEMNAAISNSNGILGKMIQVQADIEAVKKQWGDDGPKKSYAQFQGGDRLKAFLFSVQQNN